MCDDGTVIPDSKVCDKTPDCPDESDENICGCVESEVSTHTRNYSSIFDTLEY